MRGEERRCWLCKEPGGVVEKVLVWLPTTYALLSTKSCYDVSSELKKEIVQSSLTLQPRYQMRGARKKVPPQATFRQQY